MSKRILIIDGHPDPDDARYVHALGETYRAAAVHAKHEVQLLRLADANIPLLRSNDEFVHQAAPAVIRRAQAQLSWCTHLVILYPLWLGSMPALLKAFFEQALRPGFAFQERKGGKPPKKMLAGKSARIVVTMGMPAFFYRWYFRAHSVKVLERNILKATGFGPVNATLIGGVETQSRKRRSQWLEEMRKLGRSGR